MNERVALAWLVPLRLLCGVVLIMEGWGKFQGGWLHGTALLATLNGWVEAGKPFKFFLPMLESARAHPKIFGTLITMGELTVGLSMVLGLFTRLFAFLGAVMLFSVAFGAGQRLAPPGNAVLMGAIMVTFLFVPPGRALGFDQVLRARLPRWLS
jgi:thiosulfate dehydrogenase [quinone] large subunit